MRNGRKFKGAGSENVQIVGKVRAVSKVMGRAKRTKGAQKSNVPAKAEFPVRPVRKKPKQNMSRPRRALMSWGSPGLEKSCLTPVENGVLRYACLTLLAFSWPAQASSNHGPPQMHFKRHGEEAHP